MSFIFFNYLNCIDLKKNRLPPLLVRDCARNDDATSATAATARLERHGINNYIIIIIKIKLFDIFFIALYKTNRATTDGIREVCRVSRLFLDNLHLPDRRHRAALLRLLLLLLRHRLRRRRLLRPDC